MASDMEQFNQMLVAMQGGAGVTEAQRQAAEGMYSNAQKQPDTLVPLLIKWAEGGDHQRFGR